MLEESLVFQLIKWILIFLVTWPVLLSLGVILSPNVYEKDLEEHLRKIKESNKQKHRGSFLISIYIVAMGKSGRWMVAAISMALLMLQAIIKILFN